MIICKTPYRISLFGGGTDYPQWYSKNGGEVISSTIDKYIYISIRKLPPFFEHKHRIVWSKIERVKKTNDIKFSVIKKLLLNFKIKEGMEIHYDGDLPARSGMGSSSSFAVGLLNAFSVFQKLRLNKKNLAKKSIFFEHKILKEMVGIQDQIAATYGGFNSIKILKSGKFVVTKLINNHNDLNQIGKRFFLVYTKISRTANNIAETYVNKLTGKKKENMRRIAENVKDFKNILQRKKYDEIGPLLHKSWMEKKKLSNAVSNKSIDSIYSDGIKSGATGGKILGAGGGGFILFYVPLKNQKKFKKHNKKKLIIPFKFNNHGSKIIFKDR